MAWAAAAVVALAGAVLAGRAMLATLYVASAELDAAAGPRAEQASALALRLAPWMTRAHLLNGRARANAGDAEGALEAFRQALRWAPADARAWREAGRSLARAGRFDGPASVILDETLRLAPHSPEVKGSLALDGLFYWRHGDEATRAAWTEAMRYTLRHDRQPFLYVVARSRRETLFCEYLDGKLYIRPWCARARIFRNGCTRDDLLPHQRRQCRQAGFAVAGEEESP